MKVLVILAALAVAATTVMVQAQDSHVLVNYDKANDRTVVRSDVLYVINSADQFLEIQLVGRYRGAGKPIQPPDKLYFELSSFSVDPLYQEDAKHRLKVKAGDRIIDFGLLSYSRIDEGGKEAKDKNPKPPKSNLGLRVKLPEVALLWATAKTHWLTVEMMSATDVNVTEMQTLAAADDVVMKLGDQVFRLTPGQISIVREFTNSITSADTAAVNVPKAPAASRVDADVPSDQNQAPLANTLAWLKTHLERDASTKDIVVGRKAEPINFKSCHVAYRIAPLVRTSPVSATLVYAIMEYQIDLADLNSEAVQVSDFKEFSSVRMTTRDFKPLIKVFKHANDGGTTGRTLDDTLTETAMINLKNHDAAVEFKTALAHAINLCQAKP